MNTIRLGISAAIVFTALFSGSLVKANQNTMVLGLPVGTHHPLGIVAGVIVPRPRPPLVVGLPLPRPRPPFIVGLPAPRPPVVVGLPIPVRPPVLGLPLPIRRDVFVDCESTNQGTSGINRVDLELNHTSANTFEVFGSVRYFGGGVENIRTLGIGSVAFFNHVAVDLENVGDLSLNVQGPYRNFMGRVNLYNHVDNFGLVCRLTRK